MKIIKNNRDLNFYFYSTKIIFIFKLTTIFAVFYPTSNVHSGVTDTLYGYEEKTKTTDNLYYGGIKENIYGKYLVLYLTTFDIRIFFKIKIKKICLQYIILFTYILSL